MRISDWSSDVCSSDLPRNLVLVRLTPHGFRLRLDAGNAVERGDRAVNDAQAALDFDREVDVAGGVDDVQAMFGTLTFFGLPQESGGGRRDRDVAILLLRSEEHTSELQSLMRISYADFCFKT